MKRITLIVLSIVLTTAIPIMGCGTSTTTTNSNSTKSSPPNSQAQAQTQAEAKKATEKAYYDSVMSGLTKHVIATQNFISKLSNYSSLTSDEKFNLAKTTAKSLFDVSELDTPPGYEAVKVLLKNSYDSYTKALICSGLALDTNNKGLSDTAKVNFTESSKATDQALEELRKLLDSHGISH